MTREQFIVKEMKRVKVKINLFDIVDPYQTRDLFEDLFDIMRAMQMSDQEFIDITEGPDVSGD